VKGVELRLIPAGLSSDSWDKLEHTAACKGTGESCLVMKSDVNAINAQKKEQKRKERIAGRKNRNKKICRSNSGKEYIQRKWKVRSIKSLKVLNTAANITFKKLKNPLYFLIFIVYNINV
jgi:hypothetical protein